MSDGRESSVVDVSKPISDGIRTGVGSTSRDKSGRYPLTAQAVSGIQAA